MTIPANNPLDPLDDADVVGPCRVEEEERAAIHAREKAMKYMQAALAIAFLIAVVSVILTVRTTSNLISFCEAVNVGRVEQAEIKERRATMVVAGADKQERIDSQLAEAKGLRERAAAASCQERYNLP